MHTFVDELIEPEEYESEEVSVIYFASIFVALVVWNQVLHFRPDIGILAGLIGVSGIYLFLLNAVSVVSQLLFNRPIEPSFDFKSVLARELIMSVVMFYGAVFTLYLWGLSDIPFPTITYTLHFFIAYAIGFIIKIGSIKLSQIPFVGFVIMTIFLIFVGILFKFI